MIHLHLINLKLIENKWGNIFFVENKPIVKVKKMLHVKNKNSNKLWINILKLNFLSGGREGSEGWMIFFAFFLISFLLIKQVKLFNKNENNFYV